MNIVMLVGAAAALCSTASFAPQAWRVLRTRDTAALSTPAYTLTVAAFSLWTAYGVLKMDWPLILPNAICLLLAGSILIMKLLPRRRKEKVAEAIDPGA